MQAIAPGINRIMSLSVSSEISTLQDNNISFPSWVSQASIRSCYLLEHSGEQGQTLRTQRPIVE